MAGFSSGASRAAASHNDLSVNLEVAMHEYVAHPDHFDPWNFRRQCANFLWQGSCRLSNNLQVADEPSLEQFVMLECGPAAIEMALNGFDGGEDVAQALFGVSHSGVASWSTRSRMRFFRPLAVVTSTWQPSIC